MSELRLLYLAGGALLIALAIPMVLGKVPPNGLYGFRVPATRRDPAAWRRANRAAGRWLAVLGVAVIVAAIVLAALPGLSLDAYALLILGVVAAGLLATLVAGLRAI